MERTVPEQVQLTTWNVGEKLQAFIERIRVGAMVRNIKRLRDSRLPDEETAPYVPFASVTMKKCWPDGLVVVRNTDEDIDRGSSTTITGAWDDNGRVINMTGTVEDFVDGESVRIRFWEYDLVKGVSNDGMQTAEAANALAKATSVLLNPVRTPVSNPEESY